MRIVAAAMAVFLGCSSSASSTRPAPPPIVAVEGETQAPKEVVAETELPKKEEIFEPCVPRMYDHEPGHHDRTVFEDPSSGLHGYENAAGQVMIPPRFLFAYPFSPEGIAAVIEDGVPLFIDATGRTIAQAYLYDNGPDYFTEGRARIVVEGKVGFIDEQGKIVVTPRYDYAGAFCHGLAVVCTGCARHAPDGGYEGGSWGFVDRLGRVAIPLRFDAVDERFAPDVAVVVLGGRKVRIDRAGRVLD